MGPSVQQPILHFDKTFSKWEPVTDYVDLSFSGVGGKEIGFKLFITK